MAGSDQTLKRLDRLDALITRLMHRVGHALLRYSIALVFVWFGLLKVLSISPPNSSSRTPFIGSATPQTSS